MFSTQEAISFLQEDWGVKRVKQRFDDPHTRKALLEEIATLVQDKVPFQSITLMARPLAERKRPTVDTIKEECKRGIGGLCYNLNVFAWGLLQSLGYRVRLCPASCTSTTTSPNNHIIILVYDVEKKGDLHLVECGVGFPTFRAVPLDFEEESPVYTDSFLEYKYIRHEGKYLRMHGAGDQVKRNETPVEGLDFIVGKWRRFYYFTLEPSDKLSDFDAAFDRVFTVPTATPFHRSPRTLAFPGQHAVVIVSNRVMVEREGKMETTVVEGDEAVVDSYRRYFPVLGEDVVRRALQEWRDVSQ